MKTRLPLSLLAFLLAAIPSATGAPAGAMVLPDGRVVTGKGPGAVFAFAAKLAAALGKSRQEIAAAYAAMFIEL